MFRLRFRVLHLGGGYGGFPKMMGTFSGVPAERTIGDWGLSCDESKYSVLTLLSNSWIITIIWIYI